MSDQDTLAPITIGVMACTTKDKYFEQLENCVNTWVQECFDAGIDVYFYCGSQVSDREIELSMSKQQREKCIIHLPGTNDEYESASLKQWLGYQHMFTNSPACYYLMVGTDNYVWLDRVMMMLSHHNAKLPMLISGYGQVRDLVTGTPVDGKVDIRGVRRIYFPFGGNGLILSHPALALMHEAIPTIMQEWDRICQVHKDYQPAGDIAMGYFCDKLEILIIRDYGMYPCSWLYKFVNPDYVNVGAINYDKLAICHYMDRKDMYLYHKYRTRAQYYRLAHDLYKQCQNQEVYDMVKDCNSAILYSCNGAYFMPCLMAILDHMYDNATIIDVGVVTEKTLTIINGICSNLGIEYRNVSNGKLDDLPEVDLICVDPQQISDHAYMNRLLQLAKKKMLVHNGVGSILKGYSQFSPSLGNIKYPFDMFSRKGDEWRTAITQTIDVTIYGGEVDMLNLRLHEHKDMVDKFIIVEAYKSFTNKDRGGLKLPEALDKLNISQDIRQKIIYLPIKQYPESCKTSWDREAYVRNYPYAKGMLQKYPSDSIFLVADIDEIYNSDRLPRQIEIHKESLDKPHSIEMSFHYYSIKWCKKFKWFHPFVCTLKGIEEQNGDLHAIRQQFGRRPIIKTSGWHLSYFLTPEEIVKKIENFAHTEFDHDQYKNVKKIQLLINNGKDVFNRGSHEDMMVYNAFRPKNLALLDESYR